jgi:hypothetical protein
MELLRNRSVKRKKQERKFIIMTFDCKNARRLAVFRNEGLGNCMKLINHVY